MARRAIALRAALTLIVALSAPAGAQAAGWSHPFRFAGPFSGDVAAPAVAFSSSGQTAVAFALGDEDHPWVSQAITAVRSANGRMSRMVLPSAKEVLALAFERSTLELLTGTSSPGQGCCTGAQAVSLSGGALSNRRTIVSGLFGVALGRLLTLPGSLITSAVATDRAVWAAQSSAHSGLGPVRRLSGQSSWPQGLAVAGLSGGREEIAWSSSAGLTQSATSIDVVSASAKHPPRGPGIVVRMPLGYTVDEVALAPGPHDGTLAWIESWFDATGAYHSAVTVVDLTATLRPRTFEIPSEIAGGLSFVGDRAGDQVVAFRACDALGSCSVMALSRSARGHYGQPQQLGTIDAPQPPIVAVSPGGGALVGWIDDGHVLFSGRRGATGAFSAPRVVSTTSYAADLTIASGPRGRAVAAWAQGTLSPSVMGALYSP
ncbi:MAG: hypothetical protein M3076_10930 [Actinomycetota bacterium]|nr:hypothetical protein [Actinomycetota bacterium]